jgi:hypothetical protein
MLGTRSAWATGELAGRALILEAARAPAVESALRTGCEARTAGGATLIATIEDRSTALNSNSGNAGSRGRSGRRRRWRRGLVDGTRARLRHNHFPRSWDDWRRRCADRLRGGFRGFWSDVQSSSIGGRWGRNGNCRGLRNGGGRGFGQRRCRGLGYGKLGCWSCLGRLCDCDNNGRWSFRFGGNLDGRHDDRSRRDGGCR